jgi:hypothetical protein
MVPYFGFFTATSEYLKHSFRYHFFCMFGFTYKIFRAHKWCVIVIVIFGGIVGVVRFYNEWISVCYWPVFLNIFHCWSITRQQELKFLYALYTNARYRLSVKLSDFTVCRHTWRKKLSKLRSFDRQQRRPQNCPLQSSFTHRTEQFTQGIPQFPQFTCPHHDGIISRHSIQQMNIARYIPFQIPLLTPHFTLSFLLFW